MKVERCLVLIDGSNFYFKLKDLKLHNLLDFDFRSFTKFLSRSRKMTSAKYYAESRLLTKEDLTPFIKPGK